MGAKVENLKSIHRRFLLGKRVPKKMCKPRLILSFLDMSVCELVVISQKKKKDE